MSSLHLLFVPSDGEDPMKGQELRPVPLRRFLATAGDCHNRSRSRLDLPYDNVYDKLHQPST